MGSDAGPSGFGGAPAASSTRGTAATTAPTTAPTTTTTGGTATTSGTATTKGTGSTSGTATTSGAGTATTSGAGTATTSGIAAGTARTTAAATLSPRQREKAPARISLDQIALDERRLDQDIAQLISQYLSTSHPSLAQRVDEEILGLEADPARREEAEDVERAILDGDYGSLEALLARPGLVRGQTVKAFLYLCYRQQFLEHVENRESQKAFNLLQKRLKPLEHYQPYPYDFYALSYLTSASTVHDAPSFRDWGGVGVERERLVGIWREIVDGGGSIDPSADGREKRYVPPNRLVELFKQAAAWQIGGHHGARAAEKKAWTVQSLLQDYRPLTMPSHLHRLVRGHTANIKCVDLLGPDGNAAISGSSDTTLHIFSTLSGETRHILRGHTSRIWDVACSGPSGWIASASGDGSVRIWSSAGESQTAFRGDGGDVYGVRWRPGREDQIASASYDKILRCWDVETGKQIRTFSGHGQSTSCVAFDPVGTVLASGSKDKHIRLWDAVGGVCIQSMTASLGEITSVEFDPEGRYLLAGCKDVSNRLWDLRMQRNLYRYTGHQNTSKNLIRCSFSPGGNLVIGGSEDSMLYIWEREGSSAGHQSHAHSGDSGILSQDVAKSTPRLPVEGHENLAGPVSLGTYNRASPAYYPPRNFQATPHAKNPSSGAIVKPLKVLEGHGEGAVFDVKWHGEVMVSAGEDGKVGVWRMDE